MSVISKTISLYLLLSFVLVCALIVSTFLLGLHVHQTIWLIVAWPAQYARLNDGGSLLLYITALLFSKASQGNLHLTELFIILAVWWPIYFLAVRFVIKRYGLFLTLRE
ncbi:MAG: hypothetical protein ABIT70_00010 [Sulfuriferula sp.]